MAMKKLTILLALLGMVLLSATGLASNSAPKFGVVDVDEVFQKTSEGRKAIARWQRFRQTKESEAKQKLMPLKEQLEARVVEFQKQAETMKPEAREKKQQMLQQQYMELMETAQKYEADAQGEYERIMGPIQQRLQEVIYDMGIKGRYTMILRKTEGIVLFATSRIDITEEVIREFNAK